MSGTDVSLDGRLQHLLELRKAKGTFRSLKEYKTVQTAQHRRAVHGSDVETELVDFVSL